MTVGEKIQNERTNNVEFFRPNVHPERHLFRVHKLLAVEALQKLKYSDELFVNYGNNYKFN